MSFRLIGALCVIVATGFGQGQALSLDGSVDYVDVPHHPALAISGSMTVEAWINVPAYPSHPAEIVNKKRRNPWTGFALHLQYGVIEFAVATAQQQPPFSNASAPWLLITPGAWHHVAGVTDGSTVQLIVDGALRGTTPIPVQLVGSNANPLRIGYDCEAPTFNPASEFTGLIADVRYWSVARTPAEIQSTMFQQLDGVPGLVSSWHLNGTAQDSTGGLHGTLAGDAHFVHAPTPTVCGSAAACFFGTSLVSLGSPLSLQVVAPVSIAPILVFVDVLPGSVSLGPWGSTQLAFTPLVVALADPTGTFGPSLTHPYTSLAGSWSLTLTAPVDPAWSGLTLYGEAYVMDFFAPNGFFHQTNHHSVVFQ